MVKTPDETVTQNLAYEIGALMINFGAFEHTLNLAVAAALELSERQERGLIRGMYPRAKIELLAAFAKRHWTEDAREKLKLITAPALKLVDFRNDLAHGAIMHDRDGKWSVITFRGGDRFDGKDDPLSPEIVAPYVLSAMELSGHFQDLADGVKADYARQRAAKPPSHHPK